MSAAIETAVILAAGSGTRLGELGRGQPKGFLCIGAAPIVEESLARLVAVGVRRVVIVTGYRGERYEELAARRPGLVATVANPRYAETGSMDSLACARELVDEDLLLLESDLVYERRGLEALLDFPRADAVLLSGPTGAGDEVWAGVEGERLVDLSKDRARLVGACAGELVGLCKLSRDLFAALLAVHARLAAPGRSVAYETDCLVALARERAIYPCLVPDLIWGEIDDERHLERARRIHPTILARDAAAPAAPRARSRPPC